MLARRLRRSCREEEAYVADGGLERLAPDLDDAHEDFAEPRVPHDNVVGFGVRPELEDGVDRASSSGVPLNGLLVARGVVVNPPVKAVGEVAVVGEFGEGDKELSGA